MSDPISVRGGVDGVVAHHDDLLQMAAVLDGMAEDLGEVTGTLMGIATGADLAEAALLCPGGMTRAEATLIEATVATTKMRAGAELRAQFLRFSVQTYRMLDEVMAASRDGLNYAGGLIAGTVGLPLASSIAASSTAVAPGQVQDVLYEHPWLQETVTRSAPGFAQGAAFSVTGRNPVLTALISGGHWPAMNLQGATTGLIAVAGLTGGLVDSGSFVVKPVLASRPVNFAAGGFVQQVMAQQRDLSDCAGQVQVVKVNGDHGAAYIVQIPGTQEWSPTRGVNPVDLTTNLHLMAGADTKMEGAVVEAMRVAGIPPDAPVMLTGHSQGGMTAAGIAADPRYGSEFNIQAVVTAGSPIGRVPIPADVSVLSIEADQDLVPRLDGIANPDRPTWVTVTRDLIGGTAPDQHHTLDGAHSLANYHQTGQFIDQSEHSSLRAWRGQNAAFFGVGSVERYQISRVR